MKNLKIINYSRVMITLLLATTFLFQCADNEPMEASAYLEKSIHEQNINGSKLAYLELENGTKVTFWEFEDALAINVIQSESNGPIDNSLFADDKSYSEIYRSLSKNNDEYRIKFIQYAEKRVYDFGVATAHLEKYKEKNDRKTVSDENVNARTTAISYGCSMSSGMTGASHKNYWTNTLDYDYSTCEIQTNFAYTYGSDLTKVAVGVRVQDNAGVTIERWNPSYKQLVSTNVVKNTHYKWYFSYSSSNPVDYIAAYSSPKAGVECPRVHVCLAGDY